MELRWKRACCNSENFCCDMTASACCNYVNCNSVHIFDITLRIRHLSICTLTKRVGIILFLTMLHAVIYAQVYDTIPGEQYQYDSRGRPVKVDTASQTLKHRIFTKIQSRFFFDTGILHALIRSIHLSMIFIRVSRFRGGILTSAILVQQPPFCFSSNSDTRFRCRLSCI
jgi:hypothetical protein